MSSTYLLFRNEFAAVEIRLLTDGNGDRIEVHEPESGLTCVLEPIDFASFCHADRADRENWLRVDAYRGSSGSSTSARVGDSTV